MYMKQNAMILEQRWSRTDFFEQRVPLILDLRVLLECLNRFLHLCVIQYTGVSSDDQNQTNPHKSHAHMQTLTESCAVLCRRSRSLQISATPISRSMSLSLPFPMPSILVPTLSRSLYSFSLARALLLFHLPSSTQFSHGLLDWRA